MALPASLRILEFCKANAGRSVKWKDTRGATQGQTGLRVRAEWSLKKAPNLPPQLLRKQDRQGWDGVWGQAKCA